MKVDPRQLRINRSVTTLGFGYAGRPLREMWTHVTPAARWWAGAKDGRRLPKGSGYDEVCARSSTSSGQSHAGGASLFHLLRDLKAGQPVKEAVVLYDIGDGQFEIHGGHHRAVAALVAGQKLDFVLRQFDPMNRAASIARAEAAYQAVARQESIKAGQSYNPFPGRKAIRSDRGRLLAIYRHVMDARGSALLDIGCNDGYFGVTLAAHGFVPTFVEQSKVYCTLVKEKLAATSLPGLVLNRRLHGFSPERRYDVVLYTDVFYHTVREKGLKAALGELRKTIKLSKRYLIFSPGRWDKLIPFGFTEKVMWNTAEKEGRAIRFLHRDSDPHYGREVYCIE